MPRPASTSELTTTSSSASTTFVGVMLCALKSAAASWLCVLIGGVMIHGSRAMSVHVAPSMRSFQAAGATIR